MARQSAAALAILPQSKDARLQVPAGLKPAEADLWREVVDTKPSDWFAEDSAPVLKGYVRAAVMCDVLDDRIAVAMAEGQAVADIKLLLDMRDKETRRMVSLATKLRITQQSQYTPKSAATANKRAGGKRPWQA